MEFLKLMMVGSALALTGCAGGMGPYSDYFASEDGDLDIYDEFDYGRWIGDNFETSAALAHCNTFAIKSGGKTLMSGYVQHPTDEYGDSIEDILVAKIMAVDSAWLQSSASWVGFVPFQENRTTGFTEGNVLPTSIVSSNQNYFDGTISVANLVQYAGARPPYYILVYGTTRDWNGLEVVMSINGAAPVFTKILIPSFEANPSTYSRDPEITQGLLSIHPFYSLMGQNLDFVRKANNYCFYY